MTKKGEIELGLECIVESPTTTSVSSLWDSCFWSLQGTAWVFCSRATAYSTGGRVRDWRRIWNIILNKSD